MKNWYILKRLVLLILVLVVTTSQNVMIVRAEDGWSKWLTTNDECGWLSCPDGTLAWKWTDPGMASWNLDLDLTKGKPGDELARKMLSAEYQPTSLTVTYAIPKVSPELRKLLDKYNMRLLLVTCLENSPDKEWVDKGPDAVCYCYALDDPIAKHIHVHFYDDFGRLYGLSEELIAPDPGDCYKLLDNDDEGNYYAFNFVCDCYQTYEGDAFSFSSWTPRVTQYSGKGGSLRSIFDDYGLIYASPHSLWIEDKTTLEKMEEYIVEFRKVRGLPEL